MLDGQEPVSFEPSYRGLCKLGPCLGDPENEDDRILGTPYNEYVSSQ